VACVAVALVTVACSDPEPDAARSSADATDQPDLQTVVAGITEDGLRSRLEDLAAATGDSGPFRATGSAGYDRVAAYVERELGAAGWKVSADEYDALTFADEGGSSVEVGARSFGGDDIRPLIFAPAGDVTGPVELVGWPSEAGGGAAVGCDAADYGDLPSDAIVLVGPGGCLRRDKVVAAQQAGAGGFVTSSPGLPAGVTLRPTLIQPGGLEVPAAWVSPDVADSLATAADSGAVAHLVTHARTEQAPTRSVIAELPGAEADRVVMLGAHLDSVIEGPGINDNGSGVAALLEIARALGGSHPRATVRMAFWSGEELGLHGSIRYTESLTVDQKRALLVYANVDMIASPNGFAGVYDEQSAPDGSSTSGDLLSAAVEEAGGTPVGVDLHNGSDHYGFAAAGVPTTGVFSGASEPVTEAQAASSGATAGRPADACYHQPCDTLEHADLTLARVLAAGLAGFTAQVADDPELVSR
jgi:hypothetical protein